jgi:hypothetical protein
MAKRKNVYKCAGGSASRAAAPPSPPPVRLDPLQMIVNVNWGGGLAVEFFDKAT